MKIAILEKNLKLLEKVKISGGGRCNVTHACFEPKELVKFYPRGSEELLGPFHTFMTGDMMSWLSDNGVETKIEEDGRVFPLSNTSQTIVDLFLNLARKYKIDIIKSIKIEDFYQENDLWNIKTNINLFEAENLILASGSNKFIWDLLSNKNHTILNPVPSLFTFKIQDVLLKELPGLAVQDCIVNIKGEKFKESGPILITHKGLSGPAILKLSAWEAILLAEKKYNFILEVNWINHDYIELLNEFKRLRDENPKQKVSTYNIYKLPKRLWKKMIEICDLEMKKFAETSNKDLEKFAKLLCKCELEVNGKNTNKDEFVTCGGIKLSEINFKTMESKLHKNLYFCGEIMNIDALTGGFNFQNAWTTAYLCAKQLATKN